MERARSPISFHPAILEGRAKVEELAFYSSLPGP
jgi:hypothetical protein